MRIPAKFLAVGFAAALLLAGAANAAEVRVMISGGLTAAYKELVPEFERATGNKVLTAGEGGAVTTDDPALEAPLPQPRVDVLAELIQEQGFGTVLFAATVLTADVAAALSARIDAGLTGIDDSDHNICDGVASAHAT